MAVSPRSQTRRAKFATFGVIPGVSLVTRTAGPLPRRNTSCRVPSQVKLVRWKSCRSSLVTRRDFTDRVLRAGRSARARRGGEQFELGSVGVAKDEAGATLACDSDGRGVEHAALRLPDRDALLLGTQEGSTKSARSP